jgi:methionine-rich copper-binding protein CopC
MTLVYADALKVATQATAHHLTDSYVRAVKTLRDASTALSLNVGEKLWLENLLMALPTVIADHRVGSGKA